jgi:hypothetical protein
MKIRREWLKAAELFRDNINAEILCPNCKKSNLFVIDIPFDITDIKKGGERCLKCSNCGKTEFILYRNPPKNWMSNQDVPPADTDL